MTQSFSENSLGFFVFHENNAFSGKFNKINVFTLISSYHQPIVMVQAYKSIWHILKFAMIYFKVFDYTDIPFFKTVLETSVFIALLSLIFTLEILLSTK